MSPKSHPFSANESRSFKVYLDLKSYSDTDGHARCSLESLGIVPKRSLLTKRFGSSASLMLKPECPPSPVASQPVVIRGIVSGTVAASAQLQSGK